MPEGGPRRARWVISASVVLSATLLAGRLSGLWREIELAAAFGLSAAADVAVLLLTLPDLMVNLLLSGGLGAALVPRFRAAAPGQAALLLRRATAVCLAAFGSLALVVAVWPGSVLALLAPGLRRPEVPAFAFAAVAAAIPLTALAGVTAAWLNAQQRYLVAGSGTLVFNLCVLAALWASGPSWPGLVALGAGIAAGATLRLASQLGAMPRSAWHAGVGQTLPQSGFLRDFFAATLSASLMLLVPVIVRAMASGLGGGSIAAFNYALKLVELPSAILLGSIATVALTTLSEHEARGDTAAARAAARRDIQRGVLLSVAVAGIGAGFAEPAVRLVLARGAMDAAALETVATLLRIALFGLPAVAVSGIAVAALNAARRPTTVLRRSLVGLALLPLLALPGLMATSGPALMGAVVAFQVLLAALLAHAASLPILGSEGWLTPRIAGCLAASLGVVAVAVAVDSILAMRGDALRVLLAAAGFAGAAFVSLRLLRASPRPDRHGADDS